MSVDAERPYPDVFLLTGFLGSGKTSLIVDHLRDCETRNVGVIVNEVGQADVDGAVIASERSGLPLAVLGNGCVCCTLTNDLPYTIQALLAEREATGQQPLERIIVETSGLSKPSPVMRSLLSIKAPVRTTIVSTYDSENGPATAPRFEEAVAQLAAAQTIVLTKTDRVEEEASQKAGAAAAFLNPLAHVVNEHDRARRARAAFGRIERPLRSSFPSVPRQQPLDLQHARTKVFLVRFEAAPQWQALVEWIENLAGFCGDRLLRTKGFVRIAETGQQVLLQGVGATFDPPREAPGGQARDDALVVIARDIGHDDLMAIEPALNIRISGL